MNGVTVMPQGKEVGGQLTKTGKSWQGVERGKSSGVNSSRAKLRLASGAFEELFDYSSGRRSWKDLLRQVVQTSTG